MAHIAPYLAAVAVPALALLAALSASHDANAQVSADAGAGDSGTAPSATPIAKVVLRRKITFSVARTRGECLERDTTYVVDFVLSAVTFTVCEPDASGVPRWVRGVLPFQPGERDTLVAITYAMHSLPKDGVQICAADAPDYTARVFTKGIVYDYVEATNLCDFKKPYVAASNVYEAVRDVETLVTARRFLSAGDAGTAAISDASTP